MTGRAPKPYTRQGHLRFLSPINANFLNSRICSLLAVEPLEKVTPFNHEDTKIHSNCEHFETLITELKESRALHGLQKLI